MQQPTAKHQVELGKSCGRVGDRTEQVRGVKDTTRFRVNSPGTTGAGVGSQRLNYQPKSMQGMDLGPLHICSKYAAWSSCGSSNNWSGGCLWFCCLPLDLLPPPGLPGWASVGEEVLSPAGTGCPRVGWYPRGLPLLWGEQEVVMGEGLVRVGLGGVLQSGCKVNK